MIGAPPCQPHLGRLLTGMTRMNRRFFPAFVVTGVLSSLVPHQSQAYECSGTEYQIIDAAPFIAIVTVTAKKEQVPPAHLDGERVYAWTWRIDRVLKGTATDTVEFWVFVDALLFYQYPSVGESALVLGEVRSGHIALAGCADHSVFIRREEVPGSYVMFSSTGSVRGELGFKHSPLYHATRSKWPTEGLTPVGIPWDRAVEKFTTTLAYVNANPPLQEYDPGAV